MNTAYVALGANIGDPAATLLAAFAALANLPDSRVAHTSALYRTAPVGLKNQPDFINAVAALQTGLAPEELLDALLDLEARFGRIRRDRNGPRTLDLDLLLYNDLELDLPRLTLPHPRLPAAGRDRPRPHDPGARQRRRLAAGGRQPGHRPAVNLPGLRTPGRWPTALKAMQRRSPD